ncbi:hypothetical protein BDW74DRAFT_134262 [Aspergillus multicolor]|uniref:uncharacterized protein n=1 Tax=Aspergillus multicolor TaxID=41759 RepID=UPI003CCDB467
MKKILILFPSVLLVFLPSVARARLHRLSYEWTNYDSMSNDNKGQRDGCLYSLYSVVTLFSRPGPLLLSAVISILVKAEYADMYNSYPFYTRWSF